MMLSVCGLNDMVVSYVIPSILAVLYRGSCVPWRLMMGCLLTLCLSGVSSVTDDFKGNAFILLVLSHFFSCAMYWRMFCVAIGMCLSLDVIVRSSAYILTHTSWSTGGVGMSCVNRLKRNGESGPPCGIPL